MELKQIIFSVIVAFTLFVNIGEAQSLATLTIQASGFKNANGKAVVHLFRKQDDVPKKPFRQSSSEIMHGNAAITFSDIPYGDYAAILFHDENSNGILDHKWGFPNEPIGFSNDWTLSLFSGMPTFNKLKFEFSMKKSTYSIPVR